MTRIVYTERLSGNAASFKGGRKYVHASDLIPALDAMSSRVPGAPVLTKVELHTPLRSCGIFHVETGLDLPKSNTLSAAGQLTDSTGCSHPFMVFPSPLPVSNVCRPFDEESFWEAVSANRVGSHFVLTRQ